MSTLLMSAVLFVIVPVSPGSAMPMLYAVFTHRDEWLLMLGKFTPIYHQSPICEEL